MSIWWLEQAQRDAERALGCALIVAVLLGAGAVVVGQKACATYRVRVERVR